MSNKYEFYKKELTSGEDYIIVKNNRIYLIYYNDDYPHLGREIGDPISIEKEAIKDYYNKISKTEIPKEIIEKIEENLE